MRGLSCVLCLALLAVACDTPQAGRLVPTGPTPAAIPSPPVPGWDRPIVGDGTEISVGQVVQSRVEPTDPVCFPNWDAGGQCRQFNLTAASDLSLEATLKRTPPWRGYEMTLFVVSPDGGWQAAPEGTADTRVNLQIAAGATYALVVMSYAPPQTFELTTTLR